MKSKRTTIFLCVVMIATVFAVAVPMNVSATNNNIVEFEWIRQFGSPAFDMATIVDLEGNLYVSGVTYGELPGQTNLGDSDIFLRKYDTNGNEIWTRQFGSTGIDHGGFMDVDSTGIYISGVTYGTFPDQTSAGGGDVFVVKYDCNGNQVWVRQFGTSGPDWATWVCVGPSGVYVAGTVMGALPGCEWSGLFDTFLCRYSTDGSEIWTKQFGSSVWDQANSVAVDDTNVYVVGFSGINPLVGSDIFVKKYNIDGEEIWTEWLGTSELDQAAGPIIYQGDLYVSGYTGGALLGQVSEGGIDAFLLRYDSDGNIVWIRQFGTSGADYGFDVGVDVSGVYLVGGTEGSLPGQTSSGDEDGYIRMYGHGGTHIWTYQFGTENFDRSTGIHVDGTRIYIAGSTEGILPDQTNFGDSDAFVAKLAITNPEVLLLALADSVEALNLQQGIESSLDAKLNVVLKAISDLKENNDGAAVNALEAFINEIEAQRGNKIPEDEADALIQAAWKIIEMLS